MKIILTRNKAYKKILFFTSALCLFLATGSHLLAQYTFTRTFDAPQALVDNVQNNGWYKDRYAPHDFSLATFDSRTVLKESISTLDGAVNRPSNFNAAFRNTQGRAILLPDGALEISVDLYIPDDWATSNKRMGGLWASGAKADGTISEYYPILEFSSDIPDGQTAQTPRFQGFDDQTDGWVSLGLPADFTYNKWYTLKITLDPATEITTYSVGNKSMEVTAGDIQKLNSAILQGYNYDPSVPADEQNPGIDYDIYWDNLVSVATGNNVYNEAAEKYYSSIQVAVTDASAADWLLVTGSQYDEQVIIDKTLTLEGTGSTQPQLDFTGTVAGKPAILDVQADNVTLKNLGFHVDLSLLSSAVIASSVSMDSISIIGNHVIPYQSGETLYGSYTDRNAFSVNYAKYRAGGDHKVYFDGNIVESDLANSLIFRSGLSSDVCTGTITNNTIQTLNQDLSIRFFKNGTLTIKGNHFNGGGIEVATPESLNGGIDIEDNTFDGSLGNSYSSSLRIKDNTKYMPALIKNNNFVNHRWGISVENFSKVTIENNTFTPVDTATFYRHITFNTKEISTSSGHLNSNIGGVVIGNTFNGSIHSGAGIGIAFYNHDSEDATIDPFIIGSKDHENTFVASIGKALYLDNSNGVQSTDLADTYPEYKGLPATTTAYWTTDIDATNNKFDVGDGLVSASNMNYYEVQAATQQIFDHGSDNQVGKVILNTPVINITKEAAATEGQLFRYTSIQEAINAASVNDSIYAKAWVYNEDVNVNKEGLKLNGDLHYGQDTTIIMGQINSSPSLNAGAKNVHISNLMVTRAGNDIASFASNPKVTGVNVGQHTEGVVLERLLVTGNRNGIYLNTVQGTTIKECDVIFNRTGIQLVNDCDNTIIQNNNISDNWTLGLLIYDNPNPTDPTQQIKVNYNKIAGNWYSEVENRTELTVLDLSGNNWGQAMVTSVTDPSGEPGYDALIPELYGGSATYADGTHYMISGALDRIDYTAWLPDTVGNFIDNAHRPGYIPRDTSIVFVDNASPTAPGMNKMARAQSIVAAGGTIVSTSDVLHAVIEPGIPFALESTSGNLTIDGIDFGTEENPAPIVINQNITISQTLNLGNGEIRLGEGNTLTVDAATASIQNSDGTGFISGSLIVENVPNTGNFTFPVGDSTTGPKYLEFAPTGGTSGTFTVNYSNEGYTNSELGDDGENSLTAIDQSRFWNFERTAGDLKGKVTIVDYSNSLPLNAVIAHFGSDNKWHNLGGVFTNASDPQILQAELESDDFSPFTIGSTEAALPINLSGFEARLIANQVQFTWETLTESNCKGFGLERSQDGKQWQQIAYFNTKAPGGTSALPLHYTATDNSPLSGTSYYRLRQDKTNNSTAYSDTKAIQVGQTEKVSVYPNPASGRIRISGMTGTISIYNGAGQLVLTQRLTAPEQWINISQLAAGVYYIKDSQGQKSKFIKQ